MLSAICELDPLFKNYFGGREINAFFVSIPAELPILQEVHKLMKKRHRPSVDRPSPTALPPSVQETIQPISLIISESFFEADLHGEPLANSIRYKLAKTNMRLRPFIGLVNAPALKAFIQYLLPQSLPDDTFKFKGGHDRETGYFLPCRKSERFIIFIVGKDFLPA